ncbi:hypothetical protein KVR01_000233 [Diaporthe batatas]|uniref:uncharacterized protein n=1 Tax=Diaporthe batatas TaxID=748121 RepID=UPI001D04E0D5|nr:uncharacterized protein KVR01_000233 [Diaporthe batatas]KAG8169488.1 hypothetical protein KVR01_000233 [Diaporthe batatas]
MTLVFLIFLFGYEETKHVPVLEGLSGTQSSGGDQKECEDEKDKAEEGLNISLHQTTSDVRGSMSIPPATYRQRMRWVTYSSESLWKIAYFPAYTIMLPHVAFSALQYAAGITWLVIISSIIPIRFTQPPYNFNTDGIGLMNMGPFVGNLLGSFYSGLLSDRSGMHWIYPSIGGGLFAFGLGAIGDAALTLNSGMSNMFITAGLISFAISMLFVPLIIWGKKIRKALAPRYYELLEKQGGLVES